MSDQVRRAATSGDVALFLLIAGMSPPIHSRVTGFTIDGHNSGTWDETVKILNAAAKPIICGAHLVGRSLDITTELLTDPGALRTRRQYLDVASDYLVGLGESPRLNESEVLLKSEDDELVVQTGLLRRFYEEYEVPHGSSQSYEDLESYPGFAAVIRVSDAGSAEAYLEDESTEEEG